MIQVLFFPGVLIQIPLIEDEKMIDFCQRLMDAKGIVISESYTFDYALKQDSKLINTPENRFSLLSEVCDITKKFLCYFVSSALSPSLFSLIRGNMRRDNFEVNSLCPICQGEINVDFRKTVITLDCCHAFHMKCFLEYIKFEVSQTKTFENKVCPICREVIDTEKVSVFNRYTM